jgi:hypothetical protein
MSETFILTTMFKGVSTQVTVNVTSKWGLSKTDKALIVAYCLGTGELHQTKKGNLPANALGFLHNYAENQLWAISAKTDNGNNSYAVTICASGSVNDGYHKFKT